MEKNQWYEPRKCRIKKFWLLTKINYRKLHFSMRTTGNHGSDLRWEHQEFLFLFSKKKDFHLFFTLI